MLTDRYSVFYCKRSVSKVNCSMQVQIRQFIPIAVCLLTLMLFTMPAAAGTTSVHVIKYANDGVTILDEQTADFDWMEANLPVYGDGTTHYYHQGPVFKASITDKWNPEENDPAIITKDMGAVKGTDLKDLCDLVGGMSPTDYNVTLKASDGFSKVFAYSSVYNPEARTGPIVLCWYRADLGYVNESFDSGIRNVMFADTSVNPWGYHVSGSGICTKRIPRIHGTITSRPAEHNRPFCAEYRSCSDLLGRPGTGHVI